MSEEPRKPTKDQRLIRIYEIDWSESDHHQDEVILFTFGKGHERRRCTITPLDEPEPPEDTENEK